MRGRSRRSRVKEMRFRDVDETSSKLLNSSIKRCKDGNRCGIKIIIAAIISVLEIIP